MPIEKNFSLPALGERIDELVRGDGPLFDIVYKRMSAALDHLEEQVAVRTPVGATGNLRGGWGVTEPRLRASGMIVGQLGNPVSYGKTVEIGRKPGKPVPVTSSLKLWVKRVIGAPDKEVEGISYAIAKSIERKGTKGAFMLRDGWDASLPEIDRQMSEMLVDIVRELGSAITQ